MSASNRRGFLKSAAALPVAGAMPLAALAASNAESSFELRRSHFEPLLGQKFSLTDLNAPATPVGDITLVGVSDVCHCTSAERSFVLVFDNANQKTAIQNTWLVSHPALGTHSVFVSPNDAQGRTLEAVFNRG